MTACADEISSARPPRSIPEPVSSNKRPSPGQRCPGTASPHDRLQVRRPAGAMMASVMPWTNFLSLGQRVTRTPPI